MIKQQDQRNAIYQVLLKTVGLFLYLYQNQSIEKIQQYYAIEKVNVHQFLSSSYNLMQKQISFLQEQYNLKMQKKLLLSQNSQIYESNESQQIQNKINKSQKLKNKERQLKNQNASPSYYYYQILNLYKCSLNNLNDYQFISNNVADLKKLIINFHQRYNILDIQNNCNYQDEAALQVSISIDKLPNSKQIINSRKDKSMKAMKQLKLNRYPNQIKKRNFQGSIQQEQIGKKSLLEKQKIQNKKKSSQEERIQQIKSSQQSSKSIGSLKYTKNGQLQYIPPRQKRQIIIIDQPIEAQVLQMQLVELNMIDRNLKNRIMDLNQRNQQDSKSTSKICCLTSVLSSQNQKSSIQKEQTKADQIDNINQKEEENRIKINYLKKEGPVQSQALKQSPKQNSKFYSGVSDENIDKQSKKIHNKKFKNIILQDKKSSAFSKAKGSYEFQAVRLQKQISYQDKYLEFKRNQQKLMKLKQKLPFIKTQFSPQKAKKMKKPIQTIQKLQQWVLQLKKSQILDQYITLFLKSQAQNYSSLKSVQSQ